MTKKGFTLIELLVVIVIIGILATIGVAQFSNYFKKARDAKRKTAAAQLRQLIMAESVEEKKSYTDLNGDGSADGAAVFTAANTGILARGGFSLPTEFDSNHALYYVGEDQGFALYYCSESENTVETVKVGTVTAPSTPLACGANWNAAETAVAVTSASGQSLIQLNN